MLHRPHLLSAIALALLLAGCSLPPLEGRSTSTAPTADSTADTRLGQGVSQLRAHSQAPVGDTGIHALNDPQAAFAARALLARAADRSLDVQYYIWRGDKTGRLLLHELLAAADRGVHVRLLLDDGGTAGLDAELLALDNHPQIEVRLFNPFVLRWPKPLGYVTDFRRANRRMHNKSFTADNQASIVGGRNVGNEYFGATDGVLFADLDVLAVGPAVQHISSDFDRYWASGSAYPVDRIVTGTPDLTLEELRTQGALLEQSTAAQDYRAAIARTPFIQDLLQAKLPLAWAPAHLVSDDPAKGLGQASANGLIGHQLALAIGAPQHSVDLISPYFVPTQAGVEAFAQLHRQGIRVRILTNALEATDVAVVHAGYAKYRKPLLEQGVELYEMRRQAPEYLQEEERDRLKLNPLGSSGSSLHAKTFAVDGQRAFVGSFNFDPRSLLLNTEMGLVVESPQLASEISRSFDAHIPARAYQVTLNEQRQLRWHSGVGQPPPVYDTEPQTSLLQRLSLWFLGLLPIEWLL